MLTTNTPNLLAPIPMTDEEFVALMVDLRNAVLNIQEMPLAKLREAIREQCKHGPILADQFDPRVATCGLLDAAIQAVAAVEYLDAMLQRSAAHDKAAWGVDN